MPVNASIDGYSTVLYKSLAWTNSAIPMWAASTAYTVGTILRHGTYNFIRCTVSGNSGTYINVPGQILPTNRWYDCSSDGTAVFEFATGRADIGWSVALQLLPDPPQSTSLNPIGPGTYLLVANNTAVPLRGHTYGGNYHQISVADGVFPIVKASGATASYGTSSGGAVCISLEGFIVSIPSSITIGGTQTGINIFIYYPGGSICTFIDCTVSFTNSTTPTFIEIGKNNLLSNGDGFPECYWENVVFNYANVDDAIILKGICRIINFQIEATSVKPRYLFYTAKVATGTDVRQYLGDMRLMTIEDSDFSTANFQGVYRIVNVEPYGPARIIFNRCKFSSIQQPTNILRAKHGLGTSEAYYFACGRKNEARHPSNFWAEWRGATLDKAKTVYETGTPTDLWGNNYSYRVTTYAIITPTDFVKLPDIDFRYPGPGTYRLNIEIITTKVALSEKDFWVVVTSSIDSDIVPSLNRESRAGIIVTNKPTSLYETGDLYESSIVAWTGSGLGAYYKYTVSIYCGTKVPSNGVLSLYVGVPATVLYYSPHIIMNRIT